MNHGRTGDRHYNSGPFQRVIFPISIAFHNFIAALAIIIVVAKAGGYVSTCLGQPPVPEHTSEYLAQLWKTAAKPMLIIEAIKIVW